MALSTTRLSTPAVLVVNIEPLPQYATSTTVAAVSTLAALFTST